MHLLILGGTSFLGRHLAEIALERGDTVTLFHRGHTNPDLFPQAETVIGDRTASLAPLANRRWDAVIDTSGYHPRDVRASAQALAGAVDRYLFVSTISVYADFSTAHPDESAPVSRLEGPLPDAVTNDVYGPLKTHCEDAVLDIFGARSLIARPGLIVGPHDPTDRFTYWPVRIHRGGEILAPDSPTAPVQVIDARDLAMWMLHGLDQGRDGIYNVTGPAQPYTLGDLFDDCVEAVFPTALAPAELTWVSADFIAEQQITPFLELPLWVPNMPGLLTVDCRRARAAGLWCRPIAETAADTLAWYLDRPEPTPLRAGLDPTRERALLAAWQQQANSTYTPA